MYNIRMKRFREKIENINFGPENAHLLCFGPTKIFSQKMALFHVSWTLNLCKKQKWANVLNQINEPIRQMDRWTQQNL